MVNIWEWDPVYEKSVLRNELRTLNEMKVLLFITNSHYSGDFLRLRFFWDTLRKKKVQKPSLGLYLFKRENFCPFWVLICTF